MLSPKSSDTFHQHKAWHHIQTTPQKRRFNIWFEVFFSHFLPGFFCRFLLGLLPWLLAVGRASGARVVNSTLFFKEMKEKKKEKVKISLFFHQSIFLLTVLVEDIWRNFNIDPDIWIMKTNVLLVERRTCSCSFSVCEWNHGSFWNLAKVISHLTWLNLIWSVDFFHRPNRSRVRSFKASDAIIDAFHCVRGIVWWVWIA